MESGIFNLKAEVLKSKSQIKVPSKQEVLLKKSKSLLHCKHETVIINKKKSSQDALSSPTTDNFDEEENEKLKQSRSSLEQKALLYDKLKRGEEDAESNKLKEAILVDFERAQAERDYIATRKDIQIQKWDKIQEETGQKDDLHYQDVLFDEARAHGVAFMPFSRDEAERKAQQDLLKDLRAETKAESASHTKAEKNRKKLMEERLKKVRQRKRLKMGLPIIEKEEDMLKTPPQSDEENEADQNEDTMKTETPDASLITADDTESKKVRKIREWDLGKPGVGDVILSQEEWIDSRRKIRDEEFAPPSLYDEVPRQNVPHNWKKKKHNQARGNFLPTNLSQHNNNMNVPYANPSHEILESGTSAKPSPMCNQFQAKHLQSNTEQRCSEFAPPPTYEYYGRPGSQKHPGTLQSMSIDDAISKGLQHLRKNSS